MCQESRRETKLMQFLLQVLFLSLLTTAAFAEENRFVSFVKEPTPLNYDAIVMGLKRQANEYDDWRVFQRDYKAWSKYLRLVESANVLAIDLAVKLVPKTDGGNLEDLCRAVGANIRPHPELVLRAFQKNQSSKAQQNCMLTLLPESAVDDTAAKLRELEARVAAVSTVVNSELSDHKENALTILYDYIYFLRGEKPFLKKK